MVMCRDFNMWNMSISQWFGKTPKISFICGECGNYSAGRIDVRAVQMGYPHIECKYCGEINYIPIVYNNED